MIIAPSPDGVHIPCNTLGEVLHYNFHHCLVSCIPGQTICSKKEGFCVYLIFHRTRSVWCTALLTHRNDKDFLLDPILASLLAVYGHVLKMTSVLLKMPALRKLNTARRAYCVFQAKPGTRHMGPWAPFQSSYFRKLAVIDPL